MQPIKTQEFIHATDSQSTANTSTAIRAWSSNNSDLDTHDQSAVIQSTSRAQAIRNVGTDSHNTTQKSWHGIDSHSTADQTHTITAQTFRIMRQTKACSNQKHTQPSRVSLRKVRSSPSAKLDSKCSVTIRIVVRPVRSNYVREGCNTK